MAVSQRLDLRQAQSLVMTPQLQQAIKLLELSNQDLAAYVEDELERNPLLERADDSEREPEILEAFTVSHGISSLGHGAILGLESGTAD